MNNKLDRIESHLENLFEDKLVKFITGRRPDVSLIEKILDAIRANVKQDQHGHFTAPDRFMITVNPADLLEWQAHQDFLSRFFALVQEQIQKEGIHFHHEPSLTLISDPEQPEQNFAINAHFSPRKLPTPVTTAMPQPTPGQPENKLPHEASLIVQGSKNFPLEKMVVNIGRHSDNDLVLNDPHISRHHAQLRVIGQRFVLFDVGSTGGIYLNGKKITQASLQTGDVLRLGTSTLIFVQDSAVENPTTAIPIEDESSEQ